MPAGNIPRIDADRYTGYGQPRGQERPEVWQGSQAPPANVPAPVDAVPNATPHIVPGFQPGARNENAPAGPETAA